MTRTPASNSAIVRPHSRRRPRLALAVTALAVLTLASCGTEKAGAGGSQANRADAVGARPAAVSPSSGPQVAFVEMLNTVAQPCAGKEAIVDDGPPTRPTHTLPVGETAPDGTRPGPDPSPQPGLELNAHDWCAGHLHIERVAQALWNVADPTPAQVRKILNDLGYLDERIHDLKQSGATTRFFLDLRVKGSRLALEGSAAGTQTGIELFVAPETGPFTPVKR
ncbi:hypothetical protein [Streptomyces sp. NPDC055749]